MTKLGKFIKSYRTENNMTMDGLAKVCGISKAYISQLERGENAHTKVSPVLSLTTARKLAKGMHMDLDDFLKLVDDNTSIEIPQNRIKKAVRIPVCGRVAAGIPIAAIEDTIDYEEVSEEMARSGELFGLKIKGDSMSPDIKNGDVVIVKKQDDAETGDIVIVLVNGNDATCKRLVKYEQGIRLMPLNPTYEPIYYSKEDIVEKPVTIVGKVIENRRKY